ncbi:MAG TPA: hypothetical protein VH436_31095 [Vicinamibacterales bacterium]
MRSATIALVAMIITAPAYGQGQRRESSGFWYSVGVAPGWTRVTCDICAGDRQGGLSAFLALGGSTSRAVRIGGELGAWRENDAGVTQTLLSVGAAAYWYPNARRRFYLRGGAALVMHRANDGTDVVTSSGIGPQLGMGYEYPVSRHWRLAPFAHYSVGVFAGDVKFNGGQAAGSATVSFLQVGASLTRR